MAAIMFPTDWENPNWAIGPGTHVHEWKAYASREIMDLWPTFNAEQKKAVSALLKDLADGEEWD